MEILEEDALRADLYDFLAEILAGPPSADLISRARALSGDGSALGQGLRALSKVAATATEHSTEREFDRLFAGVGRGELVPFASHYAGQSLTALRRDLGRLGIVRGIHVPEPEDSIASLCGIMAGLILGRFGAAATIPVQRGFFDTHLAPWAGRFFADLEGAQGSFFYAPVGAIGRVFMAIESEAFRISATGPT